MRKTWKTVVMGLAFVALLAGSALAEDVYVTPHGRMYHKASSRYVTGHKNVLKMTRKEAEAKGYKPGREFHVKHKQASSGK